MKIYRAKHKENKEVGFAGVGSVEKEETAYIVADDQSTAQTLCAEKNMEVVSLVEMKGTVIQEEVDE